MVTTQTQQDNIVKKGYAYFFYSRNTFFIVTDYTSYTTVTVEMKMTALTVIQMSRRQRVTGEMIERSGTLFSDDTKSVNVGLYGD